MKTFVFLFTLFAAFVGNAIEVQAAAYGSSILNVSNVRLQYLSGSTWVDATSAQATLAGSTIFSQSSATLGGLSSSSGLTLGLNAPQSFVSPTMAAPGEPASAPLVGLGASATNSYALGDTLGTGSTIIGGSIASSTLAELNALGAVSGYANGNVGGTSIFTVNVNQAGSYRVAYTASLGMQTTGDGYSNSEFRVQINQGVVSINEAVAALNRNISGVNTVNVATQGFFTAAANLSTGTITTFTITQNSTVGANVVPEPSSMAIFGLMSAGSLLAWRRRRA